MREELNYLLELSAYDKKVYNLKKANMDLPCRINSLENEVTTAEKELTGINDSITELESKIAENKDFIESENRELKSSNERLENITTNKEYDAVHSEIATHKRNIENAQANTLHYQQVLENLREDKKSVEEKFNTVKEANSPELKQLNKELSSLEGRIASEAEKSEVPRGKIRKRIISVYDRVKKRRKTPYVITTINWDNKVCVVCNRAQPPQKINELSKMNTLQTCETCGSILI
ncbi:zinc ribbon domain-containing protein, partial [Fibrobacterota bacterium]